MEELNSEEKQIIINILSNLKVSPLDPDAQKLIGLIQDIVKKLTVGREKEEKKS